MRNKARWNSDKFSMNQEVKINDRFIQHYKNIKRTPYFIWGSLNIQLWIYFQIKNLSSATQTFIENQSCISWIFLIIGAICWLLLILQPWRLAPERPTNKKHLKILRKGTQAWNEWRRSSFAQPILNRLPNHQLPLNLRDVDLSQSYCVQASFEGVDREHVTFA